MKPNQSLTHRIPVALAVVAVLFMGFAVAYAQNAPGKGKIDAKEPATKAESKKGDMSKSRIKVFRLSHVDLETITPVLNNLLPESVDVAPMGLGLGGAGFGGMLGGAGGGGLGGLAGGLGGLGGGLGGLGGGAGALGTGGGALGLGGGMFGLGGGLGGIPKGQGSETMSWRVTEDPRTKSLIVRGPEKVIDIAADLVAVLDLPADKPMPTVKNLRAYKLKHAKAEELNAVLTNLELDARIVPVEKGNILIVSGADDVMKEIDGVVEALDINVPEPKNAPEADKKETKKDK